MRYFLVVFLGAAVVACATPAAAGIVLFESAADESNFSGRFGLESSAPTAADPVDGGAAFEIIGDPVQNFADALALPSVFSVPAEALGREFTLSFDVLLPANSGLSGVTGVVRFFGDADDNGTLSFGTDSEFADRIENPNLAGANFGIPAAERSADIGLTDVWQTVSFSGLTPTEDLAAETIDLAQVFINFAQADAPNTIGNVSAFLRNVQLEVVPEPSSLALSGLAVLGLVGRRRR